MRAGRNHGGSTSGRDSAVDEHKNPDVELRDKDLSAELRAAREEAARKGPPGPEPQTPGDESNGADRTQTKSRVPGEDDVPLATDPITITAEEQRDLFVAHRNAK